MDVKEVKETYFDTLRMAGKLKIKSEDTVLRTRGQVWRGTDVHGYQKDAWRQIPEELMFGEVWCCWCGFVYGLDSVPACSRSFWRTSRRLIKVRRMLCSRFPVTRIQQMILILLGLVLLWVIPG